METRIARNDNAALSLTFGIGSSEELAGRTLTTAGTSRRPVRNPDGKACALAVDYAHLRSNRDTIVTRLLDWSDEACRLGHVRRMEYLVCLAWEAYDRVPR